MPVVDDVRRDVSAARRISLPWWAILILIVGGFFVSLTFDRFGRLAVALPTMNVVGVLGFIIFLKWRLAGRAWFWITMIVIAALHLPLLLFVPWTTRWVPAIAIAGVDSLDLCAILWVIDFVGRIADGPKTNEPGYE